MTDIKNREHILEAIDQLRRRKARPDIHRICNFIARRFAVDSKDTKADLQKCVENEIVYKVEYKGNISYRNAAKKSYGIIRKEARENNTGTQNISSNPIPKLETPKSFANILTTAVADLILSDSDYLDFGVPSSDLMKIILTKHESIFSKKTLTELLHKEVESGGLIKMENGNFSLGPTSQTETEVEQTEYVKMEDPQKPGTPIKIRRKPGPKPGKRKNDMEKLRSYDVNNVGIRSGGRRKRAKKVFDPSDNNLPRVRKRGRPLGSLNKSTIERQTALLHTRTGDPSGIPRPMSRSGNIMNKDMSPTNQNISPISGLSMCCICHQTKKIMPEKFINCTGCTNKAHTSCLSSEEQLYRMDMDSNWQCQHCKTCVVCFETSELGPLTVCSICSDSYHSFCHEPKISDKKTGYRWICGNCQMEPMLSNDIKPKLEMKEEEQENDDKISFNMDQNSTISDSDASSQYIPSPPVSPTPPTLSPQAILNGTQSSSSTEYKFNLSDTQSFRDSDQDDRLDPTIPDASNWSYDEVYNYFLQYFPEEAIVFKEQEIDGHSLLLMKRVDVLTSLNLKLGPALKIYKHVIKLQVRRDDHKLYWL